MFSEEQLKEIAVGLEKSGERFLWVVRNPPELQNQTEPDLESLLPEGFLNSTKNRGMVVKSWAPQVPVLNHKALGGFVTHCGWNSVLESVCAGKLSIYIFHLYISRMIWLNQLVYYDRRTDGCMAFVR